MLGAHKSIAVNQASPYAAEMRKWEAHHSKFGDPDRPYVMREFPKMLYKGVQGEPMETHVVNDEAEQRKYEAKGYATTQERALDLLERDQRESGTAAAERNFEIEKGRISERAAAEVRAAEAEHGAKHLPEVKETPIKRVRRTKAQIAADTAAGR